MSEVLGIPVIFLLGVVIGILLSTLCVSITMQAWPEKWLHVAKANLHEKLYWQHLRDREGSN